MHHIDNHTLELYILGTASIEPRRNEIAAHLEECPGCRRYVETVSSFYDQLDENLEDEIVPVAGSSLTRRHSDELAPVFYNDAPPVPYRPTTRLEKFRYFTRRHPIVTGSGAFALLAGLAMMLNVATTPPAVVDQNPAHYSYNVEKGLIEIRNSAHQTLWQLSSLHNLAALSLVETETRQGKTVIADLDGDGTNEVLTIVLTGNEKQWRHLKIYEANGTLRSSHAFPEKFTYSTRDYSPNFDIGSLIVGDVVEGGKKEIWLSTNSVGRSPCAIIRLDSKGNLIGKYWHFGHLSAIYALDLDSDGKKELVLIGINDLNEEAFYQYPAIVVLDPAKVIGNGRSSAAPAFGFPVSNAELFYIQLPLTDLNTYYRTNAMVNAISDVSENEILFEIHSNPNEIQQGVVFQYYFRRDMSLREVKSNNHTERLHDQLVAQGKLSGKIDSAYLADLKNGVRYWDGKEWRGEVVRVRVEEQSASEYNQHSIVN